jgi:transposase-like protein
MTHAAPRPHPTAETWACARADFLSGLSAAIVAERHGMSERQVRRRAAMEGWRRSDFEPMKLGPPPPWLRPPLTRAEAIEKDGALEEVDEAEATARFGLLFDPEPRTLRRFAFRRASESAALDRPQQAVAWMRLAQLVDRCGDRIDQEAHPFRDIDQVRAAYLRRLNEEFAEPPEPAPGDPAEGTGMCTGPDGLAED